MSKELSKEAARERFLMLVRGAAATWAGYQVKDELERTEGVVFSILNAIDGNTGIFPALDLVVRPHPTDKAYRIGEGRSYFPDGLAVNDDCSLHELFQNPQDDSAAPPPGKPRAYTKAEIRDQVLDIMRDYAQYWAAVPGKTALDRCNGLGFSLMNIFDGTSAELPSFDLVTRPQADARDYDTSQGRDYFAADMVINDDCLLHESYYVH